MIKEMITTKQAAKILGINEQARKEVSKMTLQDRMIEYRAKERISQTELAEKVGVTVQTINSVENGVQEPSKVTRAKIELVVGKDE